ncbi:MAG: NADH-quinone oxidoreductase subunit M [candidate division Zixibacteria bacterium]|nr:NADH-quinone oxidoreductase subunit M [candidate division Zixibacteria bacterium]
MDNMILTIITFLPVLGVLAILLIPKEQVVSIRHTTLFFTLVTFVASLCLIFRFDPVATGMQFEVNIPWIEQFGIGYHLGIDSISLLLILLTTFLTAIATLSTFKAVEHSHRGFYISILLLETGMLGVFAALDLFMFYVFWEIMLVPMYFLIGIWGGTRRIYAAIKFVLFTMIGSLLMLVAILVIYFQYHGLNGEFTTDLIKLTGMPLARDMQMWLFAAFGLAFIIKVPMWPFHTWLPDAHVEAPTAGSVILAGVLLKMGVYGFLRFCLPMFPIATFEFIPIISILAVIGIIYGALVAMVQKDIKSLVAFSSVSHMGFIMLGMMTLNLQGMQGSILQMINHGISTGALFLLVGMIYERRHTRMISEYGGLASQMPVYSTFFMIVLLSSIGVPGTNGFVGEFLILLGAWKFNAVYAILAATGVVFAACYMLWMYQRVFYGKVTNPANQTLTDMSLREKIVLVPLIILIFWIGVYPKPLLNLLEPSVKAVMAQVEVGRAEYNAYHGIVESVASEIELSDAENVKPEGTE